MHTWIVLIRGINVGGRVLPMKRLVELMETAGCTDVRTYIQSGNAVCRTRSSDATALAQKIGKAILASEGSEPKVMILSREELAAAATANPYPTTAPKAVHLFFLSGTHTPDAMAAVEAVRVPTEHYTLGPSTLYFYTPAGFGPSKLAAKFEKLAKVDATARNWNTVQTLLDLAAAYDAGDAPKAAPKPAPARRVRKPAAARVTAKQRRR